MTGLSATGLMSAILSDLNSDKNQLQYRVQTGWPPGQNVALPFERRPATFLFSQKHANDTTVLVQTLDSAYRGAANTRGFDLDSAN